MSDLFQDTSLQVSEPTFIKLGKEVPRCQIPEEHINSVYTELSW